MNNNILLLVGLGNYGKEYNNTRHNIGFIIIDRIISLIKLTSEKKTFINKFNGKLLMLDKSDISDNSALLRFSEGKFIEEKLSGGKLSGQQFTKIAFFKPTTYMNNSGQAVSALVNFYKIPLSNIIVFHDDLDLNLYTIKTKVGGGSAGHNGIKSLDSCIGSSYMRVRFGIDRPINKIDVSDYVLGNFTKDEINMIYKCVDKLFDVIK